MRPIQLWLPTVTSSLGEPAVQADMMRAIQSWEGQRTLWLLPDITEPVSWSQGPTPYDMLRAVPAEHLERIDIYHITQGGVAWGSERAPGFPADFDLQTLLDTWLNAVVSHDGMGLPTAQAPRRWPVPRVIEAKTIMYEDMPLPSEPEPVLPAPPLGGDFWGWRVPVHWPLAGMPATVSPEAESAKYYSALERYDVPGIGRCFVLNDGPKDGMFPLPVRMLWPASLQWLFPGGGDGALDARWHEVQMRDVFARSAVDLLGALQEAQTRAARYVTQGTTWGGFVDFFTDLITHGEPHALEEAVKHRAPQAVSRQVAWQVPAWHAWMKKPQTITRAWGPIGLFWALLLEQLESGRRGSECEDCHRVNPGKRGKRYCGQIDDYSCYNRRRTRNKRNERERQQ